MPIQYTADIKVHPAVARYLRNRYEGKYGYINLLSTPYYLYISAALSRSNVKSKNRICKRYERYVPLKVCLSEQDVRQYGWNISEMQQCRISQVFYNMLMHDACQEIATVHIGLGVSRRQVLQFYLDRELFEPDELKPGTLMKYYQRHFLDKEQEIYDMIDDLMDEE